MLIWEWVLGWISGEVTVVTFDRVGYVIRPSSRKPKSVLRSGGKRIILRAKH